MTRLEPWKSKSVLGKYRLEPGRLRIGVLGVGAPKLKVGALDKIRSNP